MIKINEIFYSIQGESTLVGLPTLFIRTSGCHLRCTYCDTTYAYNEGELMSNEALLAEVHRQNPKYICITGGEPLLQKDIFSFMKDLCDQSFFVSLETSGSISCAAVDPRVRKIIDVKTPDSGAKDTFHPENLNLADVNTEFKFVICTEKDFDWAENFVTENRLIDKYTVLYSPSFDKIDPKLLAEKILKKKSNARLQLQLHKYIWSACTRGV